MWSFLKRVLVEKALGKYIAESTQCHESTEKINGQAPSIHLKNVQLNSKWINSKLSESIKNFSCSSASVDEIRVCINWTEIFKYWTEVKSKFHIENDSDSETENELNLIVNSSSIHLSKIKVVLKKSANHPVSESFFSQDLADDLVTEQLEHQDEYSVDLMKDFLNHIVSQFKVNIDGIEISFLDDDLKISAATVIVEAEINSSRRIKIVDKDLELESKFLNCTLQKGTVLTITRSLIEGSAISIDVPKITFKSPHGLDKLLNIKDLIPNNSSSFNYSNNCLSISISINLVQIDVMHFHLYLQDFVMEDSKNFIIGHFGIKWKNHLVALSANQSHCVMGNFSKGAVQLQIHDDLQLNFLDWKDLKDFARFFTLNPSSELSQVSNYRFKIQMYKIRAKVEAYNFDLESVALGNNELKIKRITIKYAASMVELEQFEYLKSTSRDETNLFNPFSELMLFIENENIVCVEATEKIYSKRTRSADSIRIAQIKGQIFLSDLLDQEYNSNESTSSNFALICEVKYIYMYIMLSENTRYSILIDDSKSLVTNNVFDIRLSEVKLNRNHDLLCSSKGIALTYDLVGNTIAFEVPSLDLLVPYDFFTDLEQEICVLGSRFSIQPEISTATPVWNGKIKKTTIALVSPKEQPIRSHLLIEDISVILKSKHTSDTGILFIDNAGLHLEDRAVFRSGLVKMTLNSVLKTAKFDTHCSVMNLSSSDLGNLIKFFEFWSEIYSPVIPILEPHVIFHHDLEEESEYDDESYSIKVEDDSIELEFNLSESEEAYESSMTVKNVEPSDNCRIVDLMAEVDDEFFIAPCISEESTTRNTIQFASACLKVNLIVSAEEAIAINFTGITASISKDKFEFEIQEGGVEREKRVDEENKMRKKIILSRWKRGPDANCPIESSNFVRLKTTRILREETVASDGISEFSLSISICPLRLFLDQRTLNSLIEFFPSSPSTGLVSSEMRGYLFFDTVSVSPLALKVDYSPNAVSSMGALVPLEGAEMVLPRIHLRGVKGFEGLRPAIMSVWLPEVKGKKLTGILTTGLVPVRTIVNLGGGLTEIILLPWQMGGGEGMSVARSAAHLRRGSKLIGLETLKISSVLAEQTTKLLDTSSGESVNSSHYPIDFQSGIQQAAQLIIALPTRINAQNRKKGTFRAVPLLVLDSAATATGVLAKTLQGLQAQFDRDTRNDRKTQ